MRYPKSFDRNITYYLAGPMSGIPDYNYPAFEMAHLNLSVDRVKVESPHNLEWPVDDLPPEQLWQYMMRGALDMLLNSQGIILLDGFPASTGAMHEFTLAAGLKMPAYFIHADTLISLNKE